MSFSSLLERESKVDAYYWQFSATEKDTVEDYKRYKLGTKILDEKAKVFN